MELRQLEHFLAVAEERHFTRAAARVGIVQSGLSASVRSLEHELGVPLFERGPRGVALTTAGEALLPDARRALEAAEAGREAVEATEGMRRGRLAIGLDQAPASGLELMAVLADFCRDYPGIDLWIRHEPPDPLTALRDRRFDLVFTPLLDPVDDDLEATDLAIERMALVCAPGHPLARRRHLTLADVAQQRLVDLPASSATRRIVDRAFGSAGLARQTAIEVDDPRAGLALIGGGVGVAILPEAAAALAAGVASVPLVPEIGWRYAVVRRAGGTVNPAAREFVRRVVAGHGVAGQPAVGSIAS